MFKEFLIIFDKEFLYEIELICSSLSFEYRIVPVNSFYIFFIRQSHYHEFYKNLNEFINEQIETLENKNEIPFPILNDNIGWFSYFLILGIIFFYFYIFITGKKYIFFLKGANDAAKVINGEFFRCITSLTLHANIVHLLSNVIFFYFIFRYVVKIIGEGLAWFIIILSGGIGNFFTSFIYKSFHSSIGFSTSVFATLGVLTNLNFKILKNYLPVIGAFFLLIMLGGGDKNVDVLSHITGLISGYIVMEIFLRKYNYCISLKFQHYFKIISFMIVLVSWSFAIFI